MAEDLVNTISNPAVKGGVGIATQFLGGVSSSLGKGNALTAEAEIKQQNAQLLREAAIDAEQRGLNASDEIKRQTAQTIGSQEAALAANGIIIGQDSALDLVTETAGVGAVDAFTAIENARREARQLNLEAQIEETEARAKRRAASSTKTTGILGSAVTALGQASDLADRLKKLKKPSKEK